MSQMRRRVYDPRDSVGSEVSDTDRSIQKLNHRLGALERDVASIARELPPQSATTSEDTGPVNRDARWHCQKCGYLLGFYDVTQDILRTRYKEHICFIRVGDGGWVQVVCRGCSEVNTAHGTPDGEPPAEVGG